MKSLLEYITEDIPKRGKDIHKEDIPKEDIPKIDKNIPKIDEDMNKIDEDINKIDKDIHKENIINTENKVNENKVDDFKRAVSSIGFRKIKVYRF